MSRSGVAGLLIAGLVLTAGTRHSNAALGQASIRGPQQHKNITPRTVLVEALVIARSRGDQADRADALLNISQALDAFDPTLSLQSAEEAASIISRLPDSPTMGDVFKGGWSIAAGLFSPWVLGVPLLTGGIAELVGQGPSRRRLKERLSLRASEFLASRNSTSVLMLARALKPPGQSLAVCECLKSCRPDGRLAALELVRTYTGAQGDRIPARLFARLAAAARQHDAGLARDLMTRALERLGAQADASEAAEVYASLREIDSAALEPLAQSLSARARQNQSRLFGLIDATMPSQPALAWRALLTIDLSDSKVLPHAAGRLRRHAETFRSQVGATELRTEAIRLLEVSEHGKEYLAVADAVVVLGMVDPDNATQRAAGFKDDYRSGAMLIDGFIRPRQGNARAFREQLRPNFARLDLALALLKSRSGNGLAMLESFDDKFWSALGNAAWRDHYPMGGGLDVWGTRPFLMRLITELKTVWPEHAITIADSDPEASARTIARLLAAARLLDEAAVRYIPANDRIPAAWVESFPLMLTVAASKLHARNPSAAAQAFDEGDEMVRRLDSPGREWAAVLTAVARDSGADSHRPAVATLAIKAAKAISRDKHWKPILPIVAAQLARLDAEAGMLLARDADKDLRVEVLIGVASGLAAAAEGQRRYSLANARKAPVPSETRHVQPQSGTVTGRCPC